MRYFNDNMDGFWIILLLKTVLFEGQGLFWGRKK